MGKTAPCFNCGERHIGCHGECEKYKVFSPDVKDLQRLYEVEERSFRESEG